MKITFNKSLFISNLLSPVSKISDNLFLEFENNSEDCWTAKTLVSSSDNTTILLGRMQCKVTNPMQCIIPDCKTFLRLFSGIEEDTVTLQVESNVIKYSDGLFSFKYHLLDESYLVNRKSLNEAKLNSIDFDTTFKLTKQKFHEILKYNSIIPDAEKLYFITDAFSVLAKLGDDVKSNINEITTQVSSSFTGRPLTTNYPLNINSVLLFAFNTDDILVKINHTLKVFKFETPHLSYIVSGLVK